MDTAGLRKKGRVFEAVEKFSVVKTLQAIEDANVVILVVDAKEGVSEGDAHIAGYVLDAGRALVVAVNKWDLLDSYERERFNLDLERKLHFLRWARMIRISALKRNGLNHLMRAVDEAHAAAYAKLPTPKLTRALLEAVQRQQPPRAKGGRPKPRYAHQGGSNPPVIVIHGNALEDIGESYRRYLEGYFRDTFNLAGTPLRVEFRTKANPYVDEQKSAEPGRSRRQRKDASPQCRGASFRYQRTRSPSVSGRVRGRAGESCGPWAYRIRSRARRPFRRVCRRRQP